MVFWHGFDFNSVCYLVDEKLETRKEKVGRVCMVLLGL